jgi:hypothetical protein
MTKPIEQQLNDAALRAELDRRNTQALSDYRYRRLVHLENLRRGIHERDLFHVEHRLEAESSAR